MADNYLEKRQEAYMRQAVKVGHKTHTTLMQLLVKNRSHRGYDSKFVVRPDQLKRIIAVNTRIASSCNRQVLRYRPLLADEAHKILPYVRLGSALSDMNLPEEGYAPNAFIVICSTVPETRSVSIDLGISVQSMLLQAVEMGLNGICIGAFDKDAIMRELHLAMEPALLLAIGKGSDKIEIVDVCAGENLSYYRSDGVHYVPKLLADDLIIE